MPFLLTSNSQSSCLGLSNSGIINMHYHTQLTKISTFIVRVHVQVHMCVHVCGGLRTNAGVVYFFKNALLRQSLICLEQQFSLCVL